MPDGAGVGTQRLSSHLGVLFQDDGQEHVEQDDRHEEHVGKEPYGHGDARNAGGQEVRRALEVDVPAEVTHHDHETRVAAAAYRVELPHVVAKEHVPDYGHADIRDQEDNHEVENILGTAGKCLCDGVQTLVGPERLEEPRDNRDSVRSQHDVAGKEELVRPLEAAHRLIQLALADLHDVGPQDPLSGRIHLEESVQLVRAHGEAAGRPKSAED
mmetsp:Transcript_12142/g.36635  ORF Transcript_12142/g.36635 Transcript_12142/m.36635 type:complete len:214 (+) Transcript_12142:650-1291(+)